MARPERPALFLDAACLGAGDAAETVTAFNARGWVFVLGDADADRLVALAKQEAVIDAVYSPQGAFDEPPRYGMILRAMTEFPVVKERSLLVAASDAMMAAAREAGIVGFLFAGGDLKPFAEWAWADLDGGR